MLNIFEFNRKLSKEEGVKILLDNATEVCSKSIDYKVIDSGLCNYIYNSDEAVEELGLDYELVQQLIEDYVIQILKSKTLFYEHIQKLKELQKENKELNYIPLRELTHKNLGVAKNLRIRDAEKLLNELMKKDDLNYLELCLEVLEARAIALKPQCAYDTLKLIKIKNALLV
ncbi:hypothetical protein KKG72_07530 [bacterium]|nr:hypothetical protein [bacterium]MBU1994099.1 hypothetical protein [bacterium]